MGKKRNMRIIRPIPDGEIRMTEDELCLFWHVTPETLRRWRKSGNGNGLPYIKIGGRVLYDLRDIKAFEQTRKYLSADEKLEPKEADDGKQK